MIKIAKLSQAPRDLACDEGLYFKHVLDEMPREEVPYLMVRVRGPDGDYRLISLADSYDKAIRHWHDAEPDILGLCATIFADTICLVARSPDCSVVELWCVHPGEGQMQEYPIILSGFDWDNVRTRPVRSEESLARMDDTLRAFLASPIMRWPAAANFARLGEHFDIQVLRPSSGMREVS